jgi:hypothetical protein
VGATTLVVAAIQGTFKRFFAGALVGCATRRHARQLGADHPATRRLERLAANAAVAISTTVGAQVTARIRPGATVEIWNAATVRP